MLIFFFSTEFFSSDFQGVRTHVVATTVCTTGECTHTNPSHAHFSAHIRTSSCVCTHTHGSRFLSHSVLMSHLSLLFLHGHFETTPDNDFTDSDIHMILPYFPVLKAQDMRHSAPASRSLATWPNQMQTGKARVKEKVKAKARAASTVTSVIGGPSTTPERIEGKN